MINDSLEITKTNSDCAQYTGTVTIASYEGDRLIQKETHHNAGLKNLFEFMSSCLQGNWYEARFKRPCKLVMLRAGDGESSEITLPTNMLALDNKERHYWSSYYAVCSPVMYDTAATATNSAESSSVTYHFRVPFLSLVGGSQIKKLLLLPPQATNYQTDACAYFILDTAIQVPEFSANFTVIIDWTLTFNNSTTNAPATGTN
jgi:hypothetical protein